jgi:hypothetical protein
VDGAGVVLGRSSPILKNIPFFPCNRCRPGDAPCPLYTLIKTCNDPLSPASQRRLIDMFFLYCFSFGLFVVDYFSD